MAEERVQRRLAAILAADVVGYSRLMGRDEEGTLARLTAHRRELMEPCIAGHGGRIVKHTGDGVLAEFPSVVEAVRCAVEIQDRMQERNASTPAGRRVEFRIGVNLGDVMVQDDDVFGDGVNVAARLEGLAAPGGVHLSDDAYRQVRGRVDVAFDDLGPQKLKNIAEPVRVYRISPKGTGADASRLPPTAGIRPTLPDKPSIAVLPFKNLSGDGEQEYFADGLTEDIITTLSKVSGLLVIARHAAFAYKNQAHDLRQIAAELGVRYILEGSVRTSAKRMRISMQLIDARDGDHVWAERYDRVMDDVFAIQDEITLKIATELQVHLTEGEQARIRYTTTSNVEAWKNWVQGVAYYRCDVTKDGVGRAREFWEKALALDPGSAALNAMLGLMHWASARFEWWDDKETALARGRDYTRAALAIDGENADAHTVRALLLLMVGRHDEAVADARRAIELGPGSADAAVFASLVFNFSDLPEEALAQIQKAMRLSPIYPSWYLGDLGFSYRLLGRYEDAVSVFKDYGVRSPGFGHIDLVILYHDLNRKEDAKSEAARLMAARPGFTITSWRRSQLYKNSALLEADTVALREAGLPE